MKAYLRVFLILIASYFVLILASSLMPDINITHNINESRKIFDQDGDYPRVSKNLIQTQLDNFTDILVMVPRTNVDESVFRHSMNMNGYPRYWHGYTVFLRPMLSVFDMNSVRIVYGITVLTLICLVFNALYKSISWEAALGFSIAMAFAHAEVFGMSMQFSNAFILTFICMLFIYKKRNAIADNSDKVPLYFFVFGSLVNFIDLLTAPIVTLTMPLLMVIIYISNRSTATKSTILTIYCAISWGVGYALTWVSKWLIAAAILQQNVPMDAIHQTFFRVMGDNEWPTDRVATLLANFEYMFLNAWVAPVILLILAASILMKNVVSRAISIPLALISLAPYAWYLLLANHSQLHSFFTFRAQTGTMLIAVFFALSIIFRDRKTNQ
ncbi:MULTISPECIES: hypothetical protein [Enterobacteriaceae]|uniref:hypothetical protein n=1 Tax=Enterobacteriaceae TaxID=543 RepID=UPI0004D97366|nr:hypothetical protein [Escherichia coli]EFN8711755.1 hypothetical protein [Escherichia coli O130]EEW8343697.1 hypothetical protein [Escherichia coli]EFB6865421.1 hypothetical protein [Escherichia coli]EFG2118983.1 hypothetical protein [Escherichia coli]EFU7179117.1 hypothetical protein [Escherichia coli]